MVLLSKQKCWSELSGTPMIHVNNMPFQRETFFLKTILALNPLHWISDCPDGVSEGQAAISESETGASRLQPVGDCFCNSSIQAQFTNQKIHPFDIHSPWVISSSTLLLPQCNFRTFPVFLRETLCPFSSRFPFHLSLSITNLLSISLELLIMAYFR